MRDQQINTFGKGMMKDLGVTIPQEGSYVDAQNIRIISDGSGTENGSGIVIDVKGNKEVLDLGSGLSYGYPEIYTVAVESGLELLTDFDIVSGNYIIPAGIHYIQVNNTTIIKTTSCESTMYFSSDDEDSLYEWVSNNVLSCTEPEQGVEAAVCDCTGVQIYQGLNISFYESLAAEGITAATVLGHTTIRNTLVLFTLLNPDAETVSAIITSNLDALPLVATIVYIGDLNFNSSYPIEAIGRYESEQVQRIYWTDNLNPVRTLNIKGEGVDEVPVDELSLNPPVNFGAPRIMEVNGSGELPAGMYQYAYRLKTEEGAVTRFSPLSNFVHIVKGVEYWDYSEDPEAHPEYSNTIPGELTDKGVSIKLTNLDLDYDYIELVTLHKISSKGISDAYIVDTSKLTGVEEIIRHVNNTGIPILIEEVTEFTNIPSKVKSISDKDNRLFMGGISYAPFDLEFNARAYRYKRSDNERYPRLSIEDTSTSPTTSTYADFDFDPFTEEGADTYTIEDNLNAINPYNEHGLEASENNLVYKFRKNGVTLGGEGPNVKYKFIKKRMSGNTTWDIPDISPFVKSEFRAAGCSEDEIANGDYKSPINAAEFVGYHRDEIYRFGVVLYDLQGNPGFVNWIGDIRFPDYHDYDHEGADNGGIYNFTLAQHDDTYSGTNYNFDSETLGAYEHMEDFSPADEGVYSLVESSYDNDDTAFNNFAYNSLYALGIQFQVNIPNSIKPLISGYKVVRVERKETDKTVLGSGLINYFSSFSGTSDQDGFHSFARYAEGDSDIPLGYDAAFAGEGSLPSYSQSNFLLSLDSPEFPFTQNYPLGGGGCTYLKVIGAVTGRREDNFNTIDSGSAAIYSSHKLALTQDYLYSTYIIDYSSKLRRGENGLSIPGFSIFDNYSGIQNKSKNTINTINGIGEETCVIKLGDPLLSPYLITNPNSPLYGTEIELPNFGLESFQWLQTGSTDYVSASLSTYSGDLGTIGTGKLLGSIKKEIYGIQYNGKTDLDRKDNTYISAGPFINILGDGYIDAEWYSHSVWGGDTYVVMYDLEKVRRHGGDIDSGTGSGADRKTVNYAFPVETSINTSLRGGWHFANKKDWDVYTDTPLNTFELENCYSSENTTEVFIPKPLNFKETSEYDSRILYSDPKINGAVVDGWRQFKLENYRDVEGGYGAMTKLLVHKDVMFFLQERGFGALSISPTSTVVDSDGTSIILGTGSVIQNFKYYSTTVGAQDIRGVINTTKGIYWVDKMTKKAYAFRANGLDSISDTHGMKSWFSENVSKDSRIVLGNDVINDEVLFSIDDTTLAFSEVINKFTSFYPYGTLMYINTFNRLFSIDPVNTESMYEHNKGASKSFYGEIKDSWIEFLVNKNPIYTKVFDNIEWYTASNTNKFEGSIFTNSVDTPQTDDLSEAVSRERTTRMPVPRTATNSRFRDTYMKVKLSTSKEFTLHYVKTSFRISKR